MSFDSFEMLARTVTFNPYITGMLTPLQETLATATNTKVIAKAEQILQRMMLGLVPNRSVDSVSLLLFVDAILNRHVDVALDTDEAPPPPAKPLEPSRRAILQEIKAEQEQRHIVAAEPEAFFRPISNPQVLARSASEHLLAEFALALMYHWLKHGRMDAGNPQQAAMMDPYLAKLTRAMQSKFNKTAILALKVRRLCHCRVGRSANHPCSFTHTMVVLL